MASTSAYICGMRTSVQWLRSALLLGFIWLLFRLLGYLQWTLSVQEPWYWALIALVALGLGLWVGQRQRTNPPAVAEFSQVPSALQWPNQPTEMARKAGITQREWELWSDVAMGLSNAEIAEKRFISIPTVKTHLGHLYHKIHVNRRAQAIQKAVQWGLGVPTA